MPHSQKTCNVADIARHIISALQFTNLSSKFLLPEIWGFMIFNPPPHPPPKKISSPAAVANTSINGIDQESVTF